MENDRTGLSRRGFISGVAASLAAPLVIDRHVLGGEGEVARPRADASL